MLVPIGEMREPVVVLTPIRAVDESGGETWTYGESDPLFVSIRALTSREALQFGQVNADISHVCFGHWHDLNALTSKERIKVIESQQEFDIAGLPVNDPKRAFSKLTLVYRENA